MSSFLFEGFWNYDLKHLAELRVLALLIFGSFFQFSKIILNLNIFVQSFSNVSKSCILCGLISAVVMWFSEVSIENMDHNWPQNGSLLSFWHQAINKLLLFNIFNWIFALIILFSFYLIHMHRNLLRCFFGTVSNALGKVRYVYCTSVKTFPLCSEKVYAVLPR
jgi:hypothetical protein